MRNLLEMIYEYQLLRSKEEHLDIRLDEGERVRAMGLERLLQGETIDKSTRRRFPRIKLVMAVQFTLPGGFEAGELRDVSGGGLCIATSRPPEPGTRLIVRLESTREGYEYVFPCRVIWRTTSGARKMGVVIDGVPRRASLAAEDTTGVWRRSFRFGPARSEPLVA
ncbi:MAG: PilZ domain-containing protein [Sandaracinaceae bacterium]|nr:PilZ domain-containing protein [Sandaracinaceae bacterium]